MSDILIKNMEMPTEGERLNLTILSDGSVIEHFRNESGKWSSYRTAGVKAIEVPTHGRLIDADILRMKYEYGDGRKKVDESPTILEAST